MHRFICALAVMILSINPASALSITTSPLFATQETEELSFAWAGSGTFTLADLSLSSPPSLSVLSPPIGGDFSGSGQLTQILSLSPGTPYTVSYGISGSIPDSVTVSLSPVPLPASLPLFAMALLIGVGMLGYNAARSRANDAASFQDA